MTLHQRVKDGFRQLREHQLENKIKTSKRILKEAGKQNSSDINCAGRYARYVKSGSR